MVISHLELDCDLAYLLFPHQIRGIARGLKHVHDQGIVHGRLCSVRLSLISRFRNPRGLTYPQQNILVGPNGTPCITGFGSSFILSRPDLWSDADDVGFHRGIAPELMRPLERGKPATRITKASDMYAFGMLTWEVGIFSITISDRNQLIVALHLILDLFGKRSIFHRSRCLRRLPSVERRSAVATRPSRWAS